MDVIKVSEKIYEQKFKYEGYESNIYEIDGLLYKIFNSNDLEILKNKRNKLEILHNLDIEDVKPIDLIEINGIIKGYTMEEKVGYKPMNPLCDKRKYKLEILKKVRNRLEILHKNNIIFGDLNYRNVLINDTDVCFCDLDNTKIGDYDFDVTSNGQKIYLPQLEADEYLDNYMLNILTIEYFTHVVQEHCIRYVKLYGLPHIINTDENKKILESMIRLNNKKEIKPFLDNTKRYHLF